MLTNSIPSSITIATWNVNSVKSRLLHLLDWLKQDAPDIVLLQELKCQTEAFPAEEIEALGYNLAVHGQKTYNGVAILSKFPLEDISNTLPEAPHNEHARYVEALISLPGNQVLRVASVYVPNGQEVGSDKFDYKLAFMSALYEHMKKLLLLEENLVIGGDYNVAPEAIDVYDAVQSEGAICFHPLERAQYRSYLYAGMVDAFRALHPGLQQFSWWDYRAGAFEHNKGLRIDHLLVSPQAADRLEQCEVVSALRSKEKPSDHAPVMCRLAVTK
jgi:exodeoxyribonuclease-3